jgi:hypothetical protein
VEGHVFLRVFKRNVNDEGEMKGWAWALLLLPPPLVRVCPPCAPVAGD